MKLLAASLGLVLWAVAPSSLAAETQTTPFSGVTHIHRTGVIVGGATQDYHVVLVDLKEPTLRMAVSAQADRNRTTSALGRLNGAKLAVNGSFFAFNDREPCGVTQAASSYWTNAYSGCNAAIAFGANNEVATVNMTGRAAGPFPAPVSSFAVEAVSGKPWMIRAGLPTGPWTDPSHINNREPRTAVGHAGGGATLILLVVDGRRTGAAGMLGNDMVTVFAEFGADDAVNLDGGGSTALWIPDESGVVNTPSGGSERAVSNALMILPDNRLPPLVDAGSDASDAGLDSGAVGLDAGAVDAGMDPGSSGLDASADSGHGDGGMQEAGPGFDSAGPPAGSPPRKPPSNTPSGAVTDSEETLGGGGCSLQSGAVGSSMWASGVALGLALLRRRRKPDPAR